MGDFKEQHLTDLQKRQSELMNDIVIQMALLHEGDRFVKFNEKVSQNIQAGALYAINAVNYRQN